MLSAIFMNGEKIDIDMKKIVFIVSVVLLLIVQIFSSLSGKLFGEKD